MDIIGTICVKTPVIGAIWRWDENVRIVGSNRECPVETRRSIRDTLSIHLLLDRLRNTTTGRLTQTYSEQIARRESTSVGKRYPQDGGMCGSLVTECGDSLQNQRSTCQCKKILAKCQIKILTQSPD